jgi:hypothetical protein
MSGVSGFPDNAFLTNRAEQCRSLARHFADPRICDRMLDLAGSYEELAKKGLAYRYPTVKIQKLDE